MRFACPRPAPAPVVALALAACALAVAPRARAQEAPFEHGQILAARDRGLPITKTP